MKICQMGLMAGLLALGLVGTGLGTAGCTPDYGDGYLVEGGTMPPAGGGIADTTDKTAPKSIRSNVLMSFSLNFVDEGLRGMTDTGKEYFPPGRYSLKAERQEGRAHFYLSCERRGTVRPIVLEQDLDVSAMDDLHAFILEQGVPAVNGSSKRNTALGTFIHLEGRYDSGETLYLHAEGGAATVPYGWCGSDVFVEFFLDKLGAKGKLTEPLYSVGYAISNERGYLLSMELKSSAVLGSGKALLRKELRRSRDDKVQVQELVVSREKLEELERLTDSYGMRGWKDLPPREEDSEADLESIALNYTMGESVVIDSDMHLPEENENVFRQVRAFLEGLEAATLEDAENQ